MKGPFVLTGVWRDGVQCELAEYLDLASALTERDRREAAKNGAVAPLYLVHDDDDQERGYLSWEDAEVEA